MNWYKKTLDKHKKSVIIAQMNKELIIMRGVPSSGKSYLANELAVDTGVVLSADDYHTDAAGNYNWKPQNVPIAHKWNHARVVDAINKNVTPVIIDNTHVKLWELKKLKPIIELAQRKDYDVRIEEPNENWYHWDTAFDTDALFERSKKTHKLPREAIKRMINNYEKNVTIDDIIGKKE